MITLRDVHKSFGSREVLRGASAAFIAGITCIMGASGAGKTTLARIIAGLETPDGGAILGTTPPAVCFQEDRLLESFSALQNVTFVRPGATALARELLGRAGLSDSIHMRVAKLSGGMKRRVCICRALVAERDLLILDEPFKGLDAHIKTGVMDMVKSTHPSRICIVITHDEQEARHLGATVMYLEDGVLRPPATKPQ